MKSKQAKQTQRKFKPSVGHFDIFKCKFAFDFEQGKKSPGVYSFKIHNR